MPHKYLDVRFPAIFQVFSIPLAPEDAAAIRTEGVALGYRATAVAPSPSGSSSGPDA